MKIAHLLSLAAGVLATVAPLRASIDFTLHTKHEGEGAPDPENYYVSDGDSHIYLRIPHGWSASGGSSQLVLLADRTNGEVQIRQLQESPALPLDTAGLAVLRKAAQASILQGAKNIYPSGEINDLLPVFGWKSFEVTFDYEFYGQSMRHSVLYINMLPGRVIQVSVTSTASDFEQVHERCAR